MLAACANAGQAVDDDTPLQPPMLVAIDDRCGEFAGPFEWTEIPGANYELEYGPAFEAGTVVALPEGVTTYTPDMPLAIGEWTATVRALRGEERSIDGPRIFFNVGDGPVAMAANDGPTCPGGRVQLDAIDVPGATYEWTGPNGFSANVRNPAIESVDAAAVGAYTLVMTVDGCRSQPVTTDVVLAEGQQFVQGDTEHFADNANSEVVVSDDRVVLDSMVDVGDGSGGDYNPATNTALSGMNYFSSVTIPAGVTVSATGTEPLIIRSTGPVVIDGTLDASGGAGTNGVSFSTFGIGGAGVAGGGNGGNGVFSASAGPLTGNAGTGQGAGLGGTGWSGAGGGGYAANGGTAGPTGGVGGSAYGSPDLAMMLGGSGGGGGSGGVNCGSGGGGAGGGVIVIAAPSILITGAVRANGGNGGSDGGGNCGAGGAGSGGAVWLQADILDITGSVTATGGVGGVSTNVGSPYYGVGGNGANGRIRLDSSARTIAGVISPASGYDSTTLASPGTTVATVAPAALCSWTTIDYTVDEPGSSDVTIDILSGTGTVLMSDVASGADLSGLSEPGLQVRAVLSTGDVTPVLYDWNVSYVGSP